MARNFNYKQGSTYPLGATLIKGKIKSESKVNFAIYSPQAKQVYLCLFDDTGTVELARLALYESTEHVWSALVSSVGLGQLYGFRADGDYLPEKGLWFNVDNLLVDPYAKALVGEFIYTDIAGDNADVMPKAKVVDLAQFSQLQLESNPYDDGATLNSLQQLKPTIPWQDTIIYECHVKGATINNPEISQKNQGKLLGLAEPAFINKLKQLGITTLELLPIHSFISERFLIDKQLSNYWGYNSTGFFAVQPSFLTNGDVSEFQQMVKTLHQHQIEVILDVVFNHTAEGNEHGPIINFRGLANSDYYRLDAHDSKLYLNETGCGNTLNISHPKTLQLVMDSLRYWVEVMGVDGFRFDLATTLARDDKGFNYQHSFFQAIAQDPILNQVKLIAEPWDIGLGGYQLGAYPLGWREWNDKYRDTLRRFWRGDHGQVADLAKHLHGSHEFFAHNGRDATTSINFISAHDGFTLADLVSYENKHNEANGEENRDGHSENYACNYGVEGATEDSEIIALRLQQQKNMLLTLLFSRGVPMLSAGSEQGHSQQGNNNAYCQDNALNYLDHTTSQFELQDFIADAIKLRKQFNLFQQKQFIHAGDSNFEWLWLTEQGQVMNEQNWLDTENQLLICLIKCKKGSAKSRDLDALLMFFNAASTEINVQLPQVNHISHWQVRLHTLATCKHSKFYVAEQSLAIAPRSAWIMSPAKLSI
ncbi:glycogen debranching protein GlgX [Colwellia sp. D2M02]|uniref:glycogen debranching protein GlgX n=1 Tax=Colwellia sp. D2M02 TaxID=2841562 RepID=UPI001C088FB7|nr:glycogen debranching protein GlgX [Colwellia sp. D2M02]MBU2893398.1 glycogen debranching protein GlgX [Colwellia sp. D2M02]